MLSNEELLSIIREVCDFYSVSYDDEKFVAQMREYLFEIISNGDGNSLSYDDVLDELDRYAFNIINDEFVKNILCDRRSHMNSDPLYKLSNLDLIYMYSADLQNRKKVAEVLIYKNMKTILKVANEYANSSVPINDLIQAGCLGILRALDMKPFSQNIFKYIRLEIKNCVSEGNDITLGYDDISNKIDPELIADSSIVEDSLSFMNNDSIMNIIGSLNNNQKFVLFYRYGLYDGICHSQKQTAVALCAHRGYDNILSVSRISAIEKRALLNIKCALEKFQNPVKIVNSNFDNIYTNQEMILRKSDDKSITEIIRRNRLKNKLGRQLTLCEYLNCSYDQLNSIISDFDDDEKNILYAMYGDDLQNPLDVDVCKNERLNYSKKYHLYHKMIDLLEQNKCKSDSSKKVYTNRI